MTINTTLQFAEINELYLDPENPRLGRHNVNRDIPQEELLRRMSAWTLDELALSYLENGGFWTHEALLVVREELYGQQRLVVVEGNRRLAALKHLYNAYQRNSTINKWVTIIENVTPPPNLFSRIPYLLADSRADVQAFLGFRHVTGIKPWDGDEKAAFIAKLIDEYGFTYEQVMRKIGSKTPTVRRNYIAYKLLLQIEETVEDFVPKSAENRFTVLYMTLDTEGARRYLQIDMMAEPHVMRRPIPDEHLQHLANFARWLFGTDEIPPLVTDTRDVSDFGKILENEEAVQYLERTRRPNFDYALNIAGGDEEEIIQLIQKAADNLELALSRAHLFKDSSELRKEVRRLQAHAQQLSHTLEQAT